MAIQIWSENVAIKQDPEADVVIPGPELIHFYMESCNILAKTLNLSGDSPDNPHPLRQLLPADHYLQRYHGDQWERFVPDFIVAEPGFELTLPEPDGRKTSLGTVGLNTASQEDDEHRLAARLAGQLDFGLFVRPENAPWLANIIERGRENGLFRRGDEWQSGSTWEDAATLLRKAQGPILFSDYPTGPDMRLAIEEHAWQAPDYVGPLDKHGYPFEDVYDEQIESAWASLSPNEQFELHVRALENRDLKLRQEGTEGFELKPDNWQSYSFGTEVTAPDILAIATAL